MTIKNEVWEVLEIEPTRDIRTIKRAYAQAVKKYHPEENPEEFQRVFAAYKQALAYAQSGRRAEAADEGPEESGNVPGAVQERRAEAADEGPEESENVPGAVQERRAEAADEGRAESENVSSAGQERRAEAADAGRAAESVPSYRGDQTRIEGMFREMQDVRERKKTLFFHKWQWYLTHRFDSGAEQEMRDYFATRWFTDIMEDAEVLARLAYGINRCPDYGKALKEDIWGIYDLDHMELAEGKADRHGLYYALVNDPLCFSERRIEAQKKQEAKAARQKGKKIVLLLAFVLAAALSWGIMAGRNHEKQYSSENVGRTLSRLPLARRIEEEEKLVTRFLNESYPGIEFSDAKFQSGISNEDSEGRFYSLYASVLLADSEAEDMEVSAHVFYQDNTLYIDENFAAEYVRLLSESYGLSCGLLQLEAPWNDGEKHLVLLANYTGEVDLSEYTDRLCAIMESGGMAALKNLEGISICFTYCDEPQAFLGEFGGLPRPYSFHAGDLPDAGQLGDIVMGQAMEYYIHLEPWNVEDTSDYGKWKIKYDRKAALLQDEPQTDSGRDVAELARQCGETALVYAKSIREYIAEGGIYRLNRIEYITAGDMYRIAKASGMDARMKRDGDGYLFEWKEDSGIYQVKITGADVMCSVVLDIIRNHSQLGKP